MTNKVVKDFIPKSLKAVMFHNVGIYLLIKSKEKSGYNFDLECTYWIEEGTWYNTKICTDLSGTDFDFCYFTSIQVYTNVHR